MPNLLITCGHLIRHRGGFAGEFAANGVNATYPEVGGQQLSAAEMRKAIAGQHVVIAGDDFIDRDVLQAGSADSLKAVIKWGIGVDAIDLTAARDLGIPVYNTPSVFADEVADVALTYVLLLARRLHDMHASVKAGGWLKVEGETLRGKTAGVIGLGSIGRAVASRCCAVGMRVLGYDEAAMPDDLVASCGATVASLDDLLSQSDYVIVACALTPSSRHLMNAAAFAKMRDGARLVNVARGPVVDENALIDAFKARKLAGAGLDVFEVEPLPAGSPLREMPNVILGTHNGSNTAEAVGRVNRLTVDLAYDLLGISGQPPRIRALVEGIRR